MGLHPVAQSATIPRRHPHAVPGKQVSKNIVDSVNQAEEGMQQPWLCAQLSVACDSQPNPIGQPSRRVRRCCVNGHHRHTRLQRQPPARSIWRQERMMVKELGEVSALPYGFYGVRLIGTGCRIF